MSKHTSKSLKAAKKFSKDLAVQPEPTYILGLEEEPIVYKTVHIPLVVHNQLKRELVDLGQGWNLRRLLVVKLQRPISVTDTI